MSSNDVGGIGGNVGGVSYARILFLLKKILIRRGRIPL